MTIKPDFQFRYPLPKGYRAIVSYVVHNSADYNACTVSAIQYPGDHVSISSEAHSSGTLGAYIADVDLLVTGYSVKRAGGGDTQRPASKIRILAEGSDSVKLGFDDWGNDGDFNDLIILIAKQKPPAFAEQQST